MFIFESFRTLHFEQMVEHLSPITSAYMQRMSLAGRCRVRGDCGCKHDTVDLWLLTILQDLALASYSCVIAS